MGQLLNARVQYYNNTKTIVFFKLWKFKLKYLLFYSNCKETKISDDYIAIELPTVSHSSWLYSENTALCKRNSEGQKGCLFI